MEGLTIVLLMICSAIQIILADAYKQRVKDLEEELLLRDEEILKLQKEIENLCLDYGITVEDEE